MPATTSPCRRPSRNLEEWQAAVEALLLVVELNGPTMMERVGIHEGLEPRTVSRDAELPERPPLAKRVHHPHCLLVGETWGSWRAHAGKLWKASGGVRGLVPLSPLVTASHR